MLVDRTLTRKDLGSVPQLPSLRGEDGIKSAVLERPTGRHGTFRTFEKCVGRISSRASGNICMYWPRGHLG